MSTPARQLQDIDSILIVTPTIGPYTEWFENARAALAHAGTPYDSIRHTSINSPLYGERVSHIYLHPDLDAHMTNEEGERLTCRIEEGGQMSSLRLRYGYDVAESNYTARVSVKPRAPQQIQATS